MRSMRMLGGVLLIAAGMMVFPLQGSAYLSTGAVCDAAGSITTNATHSTVLVVGQAAPPGCNTNADFVNQSGFLQTFVMFPALDHDADGVADEDDLDDDNDGARDMVELAGSAFNPATPTDMFSADSDGDGSSDFEEMISGTNPTNENSQFELDAASLVDGQIVVSWSGRGYVRYDILRGATLDELRNSPTLVRSVTINEGAGAWQEIQAETTNVVDSEQCYYGIRLVQ